MPFIELFLIVVLTAVGAFFSISEISLAAARRSRLRVLAESGDINARRVLDLQDNPGNFFTVVQIALNAVGILGGIVGDQLLSPHIERWLQGFHEGPMARSLSFALAFSFVTGMFVLFADLMPKRLAMVKPEQVAIRVVRLILFSLWLLAPLVWFFNGLANQLFRLFGLPHARVEDITAADIVAMADVGAQAGALLRQEQYLISNVFELDSRVVPSVMTPRESIVYITLAESEDSIRRKIAEEPHGKFPVCEDSIDSVIGYVDSKDILPRIVQGQDLSLRTEPIVRQVLMLPDTLNLFEALERFRDAKEDFALVINEYALVVGVITLQDVMNTVMGELVSPFHENLIVRRDDNSWLIDGLTPIEDVMQALDIEAFAGFENYETVAGFLMYSLRKVPRPTDAVVYAGYKFEVVDIDNYRIDQVLVTRETAASDEAADA